MKPAKLHKMSKTMSKTKTKTKPKKKHNVMQLAKLHKNNLLISNFHTKRTENTEKNPNHV
jgi:hypothetical protein